MTGNYYVASPHRVITTETRYSAGYFHSSSLDSPSPLLPLVPKFSETVATSVRHANVGLMARKEGADGGTGDMHSTQRVAVYGEQI